MLFMSLTTQHIVRTIVIPVYIHCKTLHTLIDVAIDVTVSLFLVDHADILQMLLLLLSHSSYYQSITEDQHCTCLSLHALFSKKQWDRYIFNDFGGI